MSRRPPKEIAITILWHGEECVLQNRTHKKEGGIGFFGGKKNSGESPKAAAAREVLEETGLKLRSDRLQFLGELSLMKGVNVFQYRLKPGTRIDPAKVEGEAIYRLPIDLQAEDKLMSATKAALKEFIISTDGTIDN